jgi:PIN domain nuclease of toxin-antitoxin system
VRLRLDTHVLIWLSEGDAARGPSVRRRIDEAGAGPGVLVPPLSFWDRPVKRP